MSYQPPAILAVIAIVLFARKAQVVCVASTFLLPGKEKSEKRETMAAALAAFNNYIATLGVNNANVREALNNQGLQGVDDFSGLLDDDIMTICENCCKPGGTIANPNAAIAGQPANITNPGVPLSFVTKKRMWMLNFYITHLLRIQHPFQPNQAALG